MMARFLSKNLVRRLRIHKAPRHHQAYISWTSLSICTERPTSRVSTLTFQGLSATRTTFCRCFSSNMISDEDNFHPESGASAEMLYESDPPQDHSLRTSTTVPSLDTFVQSIHGNIQVILEEVDRLQKATNGNPRHKSIQERWQRLYDKEKQRYHRRSREPRLSVEQMWREALLSANLPLVMMEGVARDPSHLANESASSSAAKSGKKEDPQTEDSLIHEIDHYALSPIFELKLDQQLQIQDLDSLLEQLQDGQPNDVDWPISEEDGAEMAVSNLNGQLHNMPENVEDKEYLQDAILQSIALLSAVNATTWRRIQQPVDYGVEDSEDIFSGELDQNIEARDDPEESDSDLAEHDLTDSDLVEIFLKDAKERDISISTKEANLLLAHLAVSADQDADDLVEKCMEIFNEMKLLAESGQAECEPDPLTYRIMILALSQRFMAAGEAIRLSQEMMKTTTTAMPPQVFLEAMKACHAKMDLRSAREMMEIALSGNMIRPSLGSYLILIEMMKVDDLRDEALSLFNDLHTNNTLSREAEDKLLHSICRWPRRTRRGDFVDLSCFLLNILAVVRELAMDHRKPGMSLWVQLVGEMHVSARKDSSLWGHINSTLYTILELYPDSVGQKLMSIGLESSVVGEDPRLAAGILSNISHGLLSESIEERAPVDIPYQAVRSALEVCLKLSDVSSAESIMESICEMGDLYPTGILKELYALLLLCHAKSGQPDEALSVLFTMTEKRMQPGEDLYGAILHSLAVAGRQDEAEKLFQAMENGENSIPVEPGLLSYDALLFSRIENGDWEGALSLRNKMKERGISPSPQTVERIIEAHCGMGGKDTVSIAVQELLQDDDVRFAEGPFRSLSKILLPDIEIVSFDDFRQRIRSIGEEQSELRELSLNLVRSLRVAEIESERPSSPHKTEEEVRAVQDMAWKQSVKNLLEFANRFYSLQ